MHAKSTLAARQAANFHFDAEAAAVALPPLAKRQVMAMVAQKSKAPPAHDQIESPRAARLRFARKAASGGK